MKLLNLTYGALAVLAIQGCNPRTQYNGPNVKDQIADKELCTLYKKDSTTIHTLMALQKPNDSVALYLYDLDISKAEGTVQKLVSAQMLSRQQFEQESPKYKEKYTWKPFEGKEVLFVQIQAKGINEKAVLEKRQDIEEEIGEALESSNIGEWIAGDIGPGGGNMLFEVKDINKSMSAIMGVLFQHKIERQVVIGRRVKMDSNDWFYLVIYPATFSGLFNTM